MEDVRVGILLGDRNLHPNLGISFDFLVMMVRSKNLVDILNDIIFDSISSALKSRTTLIREHV